MLHNTAFLDELETRDPAHPSWREVTAGLAVLRFVESCLGEGISPDEAVYRTDSIIAAIDEIDDGRPCRAILRSIVETMLASELPDAQVINPRLLAYGQLLEYDSSWSLASDVYRNVVAHADPVEDSDSATVAHIRLGFCLWTMNRLDHAEEAYRAAGDIATEVGDTVGALRSRLGIAKVAAVRGNLSQAEAILDAAISHADARELRGVQSMLLHDRSYVAHLRGDHEHAISLAHRALEYADSPRARDRLLGDIAASFLRLGARSVARDAYHVLAVTAQEQYVRWTASIALMFIAAQDGIEPVFERYRREIEGEALPPRMLTEFTLRTGESYAALDNVDAARSWFWRAIEIANKNGLNQLGFEAEEHLRRLPSSASASSRSESAIRGELRYVAWAIRALRRDTETSVS